MHSMTAPVKMRASRSADIRQTDYAFLTSPRAREIIDHEGITVIDYRPLQQVWNH